MALGETVDGAIIFAVLVFNALIGTVQEGRTQNTLLALKKFVETTATVVRDGEELIVPDHEVVLGDIVILRGGEKVPADARIITAANLKIDEAALTGESQPVHKTPEHKNLIFKATQVLAGSGRALVVATGVHTAVGQISKAVAINETEIPLKNDIRNLSRLIIWVVAGISAGLFILGAISGQPTKEMFTTVVSLAVSIIPEGLLIVMTLVLATGVWRMSKNHALVKRLQAVEALGQARVIAVDKTGTITKNELVIRKVYSDGKIFTVGGVGYEPTGEIQLAGAVIDPLNHPELVLVGKMAAFCADARVIFSATDKIWRVAGDPTEAALLVLAKKLGFHKDDLERESPLIGEIPFDYNLKYHATLHREAMSSSGKLLTVVGAPETILGLCRKIWSSTGQHELSVEKRHELENVFLSLSREGLRVVAVAKDDHPAEELSSTKIHALTFVGFLGMKDALRAEVPAALARAREAGIRVVMITGDHKVTARSIAREAGIYREGDTVLTGQDIDQLSAHDLSLALAKTSVFAMVTPEHKLRIVNAYRARGEVVAMTGDGVNDAPSLVAADLGVAMGRIGTEVAKEAADIVLLDDNFGSIVSAVEEGRSIYKTIKKVILYLFSTSWGEVLTIVGALFLGYPLPLLPAQIIWLNFVTDGFLDVALAMEPKEAGLLKGNFERPKRYLVDKLMVQRMLVMSLPMMLGTLYLFQKYFAVDLAHAQTVALTGLAVFQWFNAWNCRHETKSIFQINFFTNKFLLGATAIVISLQLLVIYNPWLQKFLHTVPLGWSEWFALIAVAASILVVEEIRKFFARQRYCRLAEVDAV